ncbi:MAG: LuxR C-terminal-related transcriptional regulator, partial [Candidatus Promineifilaceae bacterium]|nr:LuxR C-terminal-related transcriptional regulator [Candidatus Promineifilaceae bacterium]
ESAKRYGKEMLAEWQDMEERHYVVFYLCSLATFFCTQNDQRTVNACAEALSQIAAATSAPDALASLAYALGESALTSGDVTEAADHFKRAVDLFAPIGLPIDHAQAQWRAGVALAAAGNRAQAVDYLFSAYRTTHRLGARPLSEKIAQALLTLGEKVDERLGRRAAGRLRRGGLTRRQFEVLRLVAEGLTNQEIAERLVLSTRTVDMHVSNILDRLDSRSRIDAVRKAGELGLLNQES